MSRNKEPLTELNTIANSFLVDIIYTAIEEFGIDYNKLYNIFKQINFTDIIDDTDTMIVGAHYGLDDIMQRIREAMQ